MPGTAASAGKTSSRSRRFPRSLPYDVEFSLTSTSSRTPSPASQAASASRSAGSRETNAPRKDGIAQKVHRRSHPDAIFSGAASPRDSLRRSTRGPEAGNPTSPKRLTRAVSVPAADSPSNGSRPEGPAALCSPLAARSAAAVMTLPARGVTEFPGETPDPDGPEPPAAPLVARSAAAVMDPVDPTGAGEP